MAIPIWKDKIVDLGEFDSLDYQIRVGSPSGHIIYRGKAYRRPGETHLNIRINDICADYMQNVVPTLSTDEFSALTFPIAFYIQRNVSGSFVTKEIVTFLNDWSYDDSYDALHMGMAAPINGRLDAKQWMIYTAYDQESITATLKYKNGTTEEVTIPVEVDADLPQNTDFTRAVAAAGSGTAVFDLSAYDNLVRITINEKDWDVVTDCKQWALYYLNAFGGWDSLLIEGNAKEVDNLSRHTREMEYDNRSIQNRGTQNYVNEISKTFTLHTSWMNDNESARMHHLLNSTDVYLFNILSGEMIPVVLTSTQTEHKTYKGNGGKLVNYAIDVTLAQERMRR